METRKTKWKVCENGHRFHKSSDCPICPLCEQERKPMEGYLSSLAAPARRALERENLKTLQQLSKYSEKEILQLHGIGPGSLPTLKAALKTAGLDFRK